MEDNKNIIDDSVEVDAQATEVPAEPQKKQEKLFTQEELNDIIEKRLNKEKNKWRNEVDQAKRLAEMSAEERAKEEFRIQKADFEKQKAEFERERLLVQTQRELNTINIPIEFAEMLVKEDAESTKEAIDTFAEMYNKSVEKSVSNRLKGRTPKTKQTPNNDGLDRAAFMKLSLAEQQKMARENPERYKELTTKK
jgi:hypothetical protein